MILANIAYSGLIRSNWGHLEDIKPQLPHFISSAKITKVSHSDKAATDSLIPNDHHIFFFTSVWCIERGKVSASASF